jgi:hypothetical protein
MGFYSLDIAEASNLLHVSFELRFRSVFYEQNYMLTKQTFSVQCRNWPRL